MIISKITSGLGNQLFQYALARHLARKTASTLYFDLSYYNYQYSDDTVRHFKLDRFSIPYKRLDHSPLRYLAKGTKLLPDRSLPPLVRWVNEKQFHHDADVLKTAAACIILNGFWQSEKYFAESADVIRQELTVPSNPRPAFQRYREQIRVSAMPVSLHVRRGDYVNHPAFSQTFGFVGLDYYKRAIQFMDSQFGDCQFFVFSDDPAWVQQNLPLKNNAVLVRNTGDDSDLDDLLLMSACRHHVIANSSFSWWGAWLNPDPRKHVVAPKQWYRNQPTWDTKDLVPPSWIRL